MTAPLTPDSLMVEARARARAGEWREVVSLLEQPEVNRAARPDSATLYGEALMRTGRARDARAWLAEAEPLLARFGDRASHRTAVNLRGAAAFALGDLDDARGAFDLAIELASRQQDLLLVARASNNLGAIANLRGDRERALSLYQLAIPIYQRLGEPRMLAESFHNMGITFRDIGELDRADECELKAIEHARDGASPRLVAMARVGRAEVALRRGDARMAEATARIAVRDFAGLADLANEADAERLVGSARAAQGNRKGALDSFARALELASTHGHALVEAEALRDRARAYAGWGERDAAADDASRARELFGKLGALDEVAAIDEWREDAAL